MAEGAIHVKGLRELNRAFAQVSKELKKEMRNELREAAEPARAKAESLAVANISNIGGYWSRVRLGVTQKSVYIVPKARRRGGSPRPNVGVLLLEQAYEPAVQESEPEIRDRLEGWLDDLAHKADF